MKEMYDLLCKLVDCINNDDNINYMESNYVDEIMTEANALYEKHRCDVA